MNQMRLGIIGAGAVAELFHLPAISRRDDVVVEAVADPHLARAQALSSQFGASEAVADYKSLFGRVDAIIVAVPNAFHCKVALDCLRAGIPVLVEKPMAITTAECDSMIAAAESHNTVLAVGLVRRFSHSTKLLRDLIQSGIIGDIQQCSVSDGGVFSWPVASDALFRRDVSGGGVLIDAGIHIIDMLLFILGTPGRTRYFDDAHGGVESDCRVEMELAAGGSCTLEFSRIRPMRRTMVFQGSAGVIHVGPGFDPLITINRPGFEYALAGHAVDAAGERCELDRAFDAQLDDFVQSVRGSRKPFVDGREGRRSVAVIEACYSAREELHLPWMSHLERVREEAIAE